MARLPGVGPQRAAALADLGIHSLDDLLHYAPRTYQLVSGRVSIASLRPDVVAEVVGEVVAVHYTPASMFRGRSGKPRFDATLKDGTGALSLTFFNGAYLRRKIHPGLYLRVEGKVKLFQGQPQMLNPKWSIVPAPSVGAEPARSPVSPSTSRPLTLQADDLPAVRLRPVYAASGALPSDSLARLIETALPLLLPLVRETLPESLRRRRRLLPRAEALQRIHRPDNRPAAIEARRRLVYDELIRLQVGLLLARRQAESAAGPLRTSAPRLLCDRRLDERIRQRFPFPLTDAQTRVIYDILRDLQSGRPMHRLLQGDVGSGKTAVAVYAMLVAVANRMQAALLAPTEVLAEQHYLALSRFLQGSSVAIELFTSRTKRLSRGGLVNALADGRIHIAVGTQALLQDDIRFANLGLVVVDEQHRLGVAQRAALRDKVSGNALPHYLVMTATPIPRTLALSLFADFDLSVIDELPPGRQPIETRIVPVSEQRKAWEFVREQIRAGRQAYVVVPEIGDGLVPDEAQFDLPLEETAADEPVQHRRRGARPPPPPNGRLDQLSTAYAALTADGGPLHALRVETLHGQMDATAKQAVMDRFRRGEVDVLLATTVIEVGIDVPNATVIAILSAERFGLSQLHQLRGRVGRGTHPSTCLLFPSPPSLETAVSADALARLQALASTQSGFEVAELDLRLRGPGEFFGTRQHGLPEFKLADLASEADLVLQARDDARELLEHDPRLATPPLDALRDEVIREFSHLLPLGTVG
ncbi:MAG: ATP-dependent DNA helicase RecG [Tepidisphaerales bacterium]